MQPRVIWETQYAAKKAQHDLTAAQVAAGATADTRCLVEAFQDVKVSDIRRRCARCDKTMMEVRRKLYCSLTFSGIDSTRPTHSASFLTHTRACPPEPQMKKCSRCEVVFYCGAACQRAHWPAHKAACKAAAKAAVRRAA